MFENQNASSSPEPRGRSPGGSGPNDANRPTSKVRASFVSVEPHAQATAGVAAKDFGTTKAAVPSTSLSQRRESFSISGEAEDVQELKKVISDEKEERKKSIVVDEAIPELAVESRVSRPIEQCSFGSWTKCTPPYRKHPERHHRSARQLAR